MAKYTFKQFQAEYPNDASCLAKLMEINYGGTEIVCPGCKQQTTFHPMSKRRAYACQECGYHVYPAAGTIFHKSRTTLTKWFFAMYLMTSTRHGVAAKEVERQLGVTYKCAWRMCHELRKLMAVGRSHVGPLARRRTSRSTKRSSAVKRKAWRSRTTRRSSSAWSNVAAKSSLAPIPDVTTYTVEGIINENVQGSTISTDEHSRLSRARHAYRPRHGQSLGEGIRARHPPCEHAGKPLVAVQARRRGTHVHISAKHSWKYVCEFSYRRNMRHSHWAMFNLLGSGFRAAASTRRVKSSR